jgi:hypothetical protein
LVTVIVVVILQPVETIAYVITVVPVVIPLTMPEVDPTVATEVVLLVHVPPGVASVSVIVDPAQTLVGPPMAAGVALTVTIVVARHPDKE